MYAWSKRGAKSLFINVKCVVNPDEEVRQPAMARVATSLEICQRLQIKSGTGSDNK